MGKFSGEVVVCESGDGRVGSGSGDGFEVHLIVKGFEFRVLCGWR